MSCTVCVIPAFNAAKSLPGVLDLVLRLAGAQRLGQRPEKMTERRAHDSLERLLLVGISAEGAAEARMVENE